MQHCFIFIFLFFLPTKSWKNQPEKLLRIPQIHFFFLTAQTEEFMFQNVAYWPTVYRTGALHCTIFNIHASTYPYIPGLTDLQEKVNGKD